MAAVNTITMDPQYSRTPEIFCQNESIFRAASYNYGGVHELEIMMVALCWLICTAGREAKTLLLEGS